MSAPPLVRPLLGLGLGASTRRERALRTAAGGTAATALVVGGFTLVGFEGWFLLLLAAAGVLGSAAAWVLEGRRPAALPEARYALVGAGLAGVAVVVLSGADPGYLLVAGLVALPVGAVGGALAGLVAARLEEPLLLPVAGVAALALVASGVVAVERSRPRLPGSHLQVEGPSTAGSATQLAERVAAGLRAAPDPLSDRAWEQVASRAVSPREGGRVSIGYDRSPRLRRITVLVDDERACVEVRASGVTSYPGGCRG